jgi:prevent-host-death family protein
MMTTVPLSEAKTHLARLLADVERLGEGITITRSGRPAAVVLSVEEYEGLVETLDILADSKLMASVRRGLREAASGHTVGDDEVWR